MEILLYQSFFNNLEDVIYTFHMPLFFFVSGYVYNITGGWERKESRIKFILNKLLDLGVPYFVFSVVYTGINTFVSSANEHFSFTDLLYLYKNPIAHYWFLYVLFFCFVIYILIGSVIKNKIVLTVIFFATKTVFAMTGTEAGVFGSVVAFLGFFSLGTCVKDLNINNFNTNKKIALAIGCTAQFLVVWFLCMYKIKVGTLVAITGILACIAAMNLIRDFTSLNKIILALTKYSMPIYLLHSIFTAAIRIVLVKINITDYYVHMVAGVLVGVIIPSVAAVISAKLCWTDFVWYPNATLKKLKSKKNIKNDMAV